MVAAPEFVLGLAAGHGGRDRGTTAGADRGLLEADYVRRLADRAQLAIGPWLPVHRINPTDATMGPAERGRAALAAGLSCVFELHCNEADNPRAHGAHILYLPGDDIARQIAEVIAKAWPERLRRKNLHPTKLGGLYIAGGCEPVGPLWPRARALIRAYAPTPCIVVELGYVSNGVDCVALQDGAVLVGMIEALLRGGEMARRLLATPD